MDITIFLAQFWGWLLVITGLIYLLRMKTLTEMIKIASDDKGFTLISGYLALIIGLITIVLHNVWIADWPVIITVLGWFSLLRGIIRIGFPEATQKLVMFFMGKTLLIQILLVIFLFLGAWLLWMSLG